ncbi:unnamed protein product [Orchesella dallaii]|uniref:C2H2-type domain-containing protein n=1 Tax=Orchesella dallaii TaxID=48710 RepID=A0ABP1S500_9HEXA
MSSTRELVHCLFCASPCSPTFTVIEGNLTRVKTEEEQVLDKAETPRLALQLRVIFILKRIFNFEDEKLTNFLGKLDGQLDPEFWVRLCKPCEDLVRDYYQTFKKDLELQRKLTSISTRLKAHIEETREVHEEMQEEDEESPAIHIWKEVREAVLNQNGNKSVTNEIEVEMEADARLTTPSVTTIFNTIGDNSAEILIDGDIRADWYGEEGTLYLDIPDLSTLKEILGLDFQLGSGQASNHKVFIEEKQFPNNKQSKSEPSPSTKRVFKPATASAQPKPTSEQPKKNDKDKDSIPIPAGYLKYGDRLFRKLTCEQCPYYTANVNYLKSHQKLHQPGPKSSKAVTCPICSWVMLSSRLPMHNDAHHHSSTLLSQNQEGQGQSQAPKNKEEIGTEEKSRKYFKCPDCGALHVSLLRLRVHLQKLHESGKGVKCPDCGWLVSNLKGHMVNWHPQEGTVQARVRKRTASYPIIEVERVNDASPSPRLPANMKITTAASIRIRQTNLIKTKKRRKNMSSLIPQYRRAAPVKNFSCEKCPYTARDLGYLKNHRKLHQPGSKGVTCSICKIVMQPFKVVQHNDIYHPSVTFEEQDGPDEEVVGRRSRFNRYYKCPDCGALCSALLRLRVDHQKLHESGEGVRCDECGWLTSNLKKHMMNWHPPEGSAQARLRKRTAAYRIVEVKKAKLINWSGKGGKKSEEI